jgi:hypothetical protein
VKISKEQIKIIYTLAQELGLVDRLASRDTLHEMIEAMAGKSHVSDLTSLEAIQIIDRLKSGMKGAGRVAKARTAATDIPNRATQAQKAKIWALMFEIRKHDPEPAAVQLEQRLQGFLRKYAGVDSINFLNAAQAWRVIEGLKGLQASQSGMKAARRS